MDFESLLPKEEQEIDESSEEIDESGKRINEPEEQISQNQFYDIITGRKPDWQTIIYDLIHSEQLDPWNIDLILLTEKYFEKVIEIETDSEDIDFYNSSRVLLAASLLLRIKSEVLLNKSIKSIDDILFGKKDEPKYVVERIEIDEGDLPLLIPKTPLPRLRRVTLNELMSALNKAINTESRRIKREVSIKRAKKLSEVDFPTFKRIDLKDRIRQFYARVLTSIKAESLRPENRNKVTYSMLIGKEKEEKLACFLPLLHLSENQKLWLEQEGHLDEIWVYLYDYFDKNRDKFIEELEEDIEDMKVELGENLEERELTGIEKAQLKLREKRKFEEEIARELAEELGQGIEEMSKEKKIDRVSGFDDL